MRHICSCSAGQKAIKRILHILAVLLFHQITGKMRTGQHAVPSQCQCPFVTTRNFVFFQTVSQFQTAFRPGLFLSGKQCLQFRISGINIQTDHMNFDSIPGTGNLNPRHQIQRQIVVFDSSLSQCNTVYGIVISERKNIHFFFNSTGNQFRRRQ